MLLLNNADSKEIFIDIIENETCKVTVVEDYETEASDTKGLWKYKATSSEKTATITIYMNSFEKIFKDFEENTKTEDIKERTDKGIKVTEYGEGDEK